MNIATILYIDELHDSHTILTEKKNVGLIYI